MQSIQSNLLQSAGTTNDVPDVMKTIGIIAAP